MIHDEELDLHRHIHLENNILFPRAIEVEEKTRTTPVGTAFRSTAAPGCSVSVPRRPSGGRKAG
jgi:hypothetical protein